MPSEDTAIQTSDVARDLDVGSTDEAMQLIKRQAREIGTHRRELRDRRI